MQTLSLEGAMDIDQSVRSAAARGERIPHDDFSSTLFRQPALNEGKLKPALYRHGKPMLPEGVYGPRGEPSSTAIAGGRPSVLSPRNTEPGRSADLEEGGGRHQFPFAPVSPTVKSPVIKMRSPAQEALDKVEVESAATDEDDFEAEDEEEESREKDVDAAVDALLEDENSRRAVNAVSEQISAIRRQTIIGVGTRKAATSSSDNSPEIGPHMKLHTFNSRDLEDLAGDRADELKVS